MPTAQQDTEITLGTGRMLAIFFAFVLVCAFFFGIGFSLGRKTTITVAGNLLSAATGNPAAIVRPSAAKNDAGQAGAPSSSSGDFSFYKAVGAKNADAALTPEDATHQDVKTQTAISPAATVTAETPARGASDSATAIPGGYYVQVAAVSRQEDAEALVEALKKKQYPAFSANNNSSDKFYRVQVGPYAELKDAEAMRARLISDGYNPIVKK